MKTTKLIGMLSFMLMLMTANFVKAQDDEKNVIKDFSGLTLDQLQQHRSQLLALSTSDDYQKKVSKMEDANVPKDSGIESVDKIAAMLGKMISKVHDNRAVLTSMYSGVTGNNMDGTKATATVVDQQQMNTLVSMLTQMSGDIISTAKSLVDLPGEIKSAGPLKAIKGLKSLMYIKNAVSALKSELQYNSQMAQNLMATQKLMAENTGK